MDLRMHLSVIWRWRLIVTLGLVLACVLAFFSFCRVSFADGPLVTYRQNETWQASETLLVNQPGGLYVTATLAPTSNPGWLASLTSLYQQIGNSATIRSSVFPGGRATKATGDYVASQVLDQSGQPLAVLAFDGTGSSPTQAANNARRASYQFRSYVSAQSEGANVPAHKRVVVNVLSAASVHDAKVVKGRKLTVPILIFLAVMIAALGLAYLLENLLPRKRVASSRRIPRPRLDTPAQTANAGDLKLESLSARAKTTPRT